MRPWPTIILDDDSRAVAARGATMKGILGFLTV
jgi:hypothetical protein